MAAKKRKPLSNKTRFEVFKRDSFTCKFCGGSAPQVVLEVDHLQPVAVDGDNDMMNLVTSCRECNNGKGKRLISDDAVVTKQKRQLDERQAKLEQLNMMLDWKTGLMDIDGAASAKLAEFWKGLTECRLTESGLAKLNCIVRKFGAESIVDAMRIAADEHLIRERFPDGKLHATIGSVGEAWEYVPRIAKMRLDDTKNPNLKRIFYIRGIVRNRTVSNDGWALSLLKKAARLGSDLDELEHLAISARCWSHWRDEMESIIENLEGEK